MTYQIERKDIDVDREFNEDEEEEFWTLLELLEESGKEFIARMPPRREGSA